MHYIWIFLIIGFLIFGLFHYVMHYIFVVIGFFAISLLVSYGAKKISSYIEYQKGDDSNFAPIRDVSELFEVIFMQSRFYRRLILVNNMTKPKLFIGILAILYGLLYVFLTLSQRLNSLTLLLTLCAIILLSFFLTYLINGFIYGFGDNRRDYITLDDVDERDSTTSRYETWKKQHEKQQKRQKDSKNTQSEKQEIVAYKDIREKAENGFFYVSKKIPENPRFYGFEKEDMRRDFDDLHQYFNNVLEIYKKTDDFEDLNAAERILLLHKGYGRARVKLHHRIISKLFHPDLRQGEIKEFEVEYLKKANVAVKSLL